MAWDGSRFHRASGSAGEVRREDRANMLDARKCARIPGGEIAGATGDRASGTNAMRIPLGVSEWVARRRGESDRDGGGRRVRGLGERQRMIRACPPGFHPWGVSGRTPRCTVRSRAATTRAALVALTSSLAQGPGIPATRTARAVDTVGCWRYCGIAHFTDDPRASIVSCGSACCISRARNAIQLAHDVKEHGGAPEPSSPGGPSASRNFRGTRDQIPAMRTGPIFAARASPPWSLSHHWELRARARSALACWNAGTTVGICRAAWMLVPRREPGGASLVGERHRGATQRTVETWPDDAMAAGIGSREELYTARALRPTRGSRSSAPHRGSCAISTDGPMRRPPLQRGRSPFRTARVCGRCTPGWHAARALANCLLHRGKRDCAVPIGTIAALRHISRDGATGSFTRRCTSRAPFDGLPGWPRAGSVPRATAWPRCVPWTRAGQHAVRPRRTAVREKAG